MQHPQQERPDEHPGAKIYMYRSNHRDAHEGRQNRRKGQKKRTEKGRNEGIKYYNKQSRAKLS